MKNARVCECSCLWGERQHVCTGERECTLHVLRLQMCAISLWSGELSTERLWAMPHELRIDTTCPTWPRQKMWSNNQARHTAHRLHWIFQSQICFLLAQCDDKPVCTVRYNPIRITESAWMTNITMYRKKRWTTGVHCLFCVGSATTTSALCFHVCERELRVSVCALYITVSLSVDVYCR